MDFAIATQIVDVATSTWDVEAFALKLKIPRGEQNELMSQLKTVSRLDLKVHKILEAWLDAKGEGVANIENLIQILLDYKETNCADNLKKFCNIEGSLSVKSATARGANFDPEKEVINDEHISVLVDILERNLNPEALFETHDFIKQEGFKFEESVQIFGAIFRSKVEFEKKIQNFLQVLTSEETIPSITLRFMEGKLKDGNLHGAHKEFTMYIKQLKETSNPVASGTKSRIEWSELKSFQNLRVLDDKGQSVVLEGSLLENKKKLVPYAIKVLPLLYDTGKTKVTLDKMMLWNNMPDHPNILKPVSIWSEKVTEENKSEYETLLGITTHKDKLTFPREKKEIKIMCYKMQFCSVDLRLFLRFNNTPTSNDRMKVFFQLVEAVKFLHEEKQLGENGHGNICPETILLLEQQPETGAEAPGPKLKIANKSKEKNRFLLLYRAVEFEDDETADEQQDKRPNDIFALAIILLELFFPGAQQNLTVQLRNIQRGNYPPKFQQEWPRVVDIVDQLINATHTERATAEDLLAVLESSEFKVSKSSKEWDMKSKKKDGKAWLDRLREKDSKAARKAEKKQVTKVDTEESDVTAEKVEDTTSIDNKHGDPSKGKNVLIKRTLSLWKSDSKKNKLLAMVGTGTEPAGTEESPASTPTEELPTEDLLTGEQPSVPVPVGPSSNPELKKTKKKKMFGLGGIGISIPFTKQTSDKSQAKGAVEGNQATVESDAPVANGDPNNSQTISVEQDNVVTSVPEQCGEE